MVSSMNLGMTIERAPHESPKISLPTKIAAMCYIKVIATPTIPTAHAKRKVFLLPIAMIFPPHTAPIVIPRTALAPIND
jgi:hypothetical protein